MPLVYSTEPETFLQARIIDRPEIPYKRPIKRSRHRSRHRKKGIMRKAKMLKDKIIIPAPIKQKIWLK